MIAAPAGDRLRRLLERDRVWAAYALADLTGPENEHCQWWHDDQAVVLVYRGLDPPVLFADGDPGHVAGLLAQVEPGRFQHTLMATHRALLEGRLVPEREVRMWRMVLRREAIPVALPARGERLGPDDAAALRGLWGDHPDRPDAFDPAQLERGVFFGVRAGGGLIAAAGTHVLSTEAGVAAIGNVFTHPRRRGEGLATGTSAAVVAELLRRRIDTIVLNVAMDNEAALKVYRRLGFWPFCGYYEGVGEILPPSRRGKGTVDEHSL